MITEKKYSEQLADAMQSYGDEIIYVAPLNIAIEGEKITHAICMEDWKTKETCVKLTVGHPSDPDALYISDGANGFEDACKQILENYL